MKILSPKQIRAIDDFTINREPVASVDLMERAAMACVHWITEHFDRNRRIELFAGSGNNGGDGFAIARILHRLRYNVSVYHLSATNMSADALINYQRLPACGIKPCRLEHHNFPEILPSSVIIDALFGIGLSRPLEGLAAKTIAHINRSGVTVISIDMPSGLLCESNEDNDPQAIVCADYTLTFQQPKLSFFFAENAGYVGEWQVLNIGLMQEAIDQQVSNLSTLGAADVAGWIPQRNKFAHKGSFGHACIIAGSHNMMGAAVLSVQACLRTGAGLVTAHVPQQGSLIVQVSAPEAIVSPDQHPNVFSDVPDLSAYTAIGIGPGIGRKIETQKALLALLHMMQQARISPKLLLDADALNILSEKKEWLGLLPPNTILTPHPKEFDRMFGDSENAYQRFRKQMDMAHKYSVFIVLKGAYTTIATPDGHCFFNTSGNPGMATGGSGDVLTGMITSLLAQGWSPCHAACAGVWLHGAAGDRSARKVGQQALIAGDIVQNIGKVFKKLCR